jgi:hypothetical protein
MSPLKSSLLSVANFVLIAINLSCSPAQNSATTALGSLSSLYKCQSVSDAASKCAQFNNVANQCAIQGTGRACFVNNVSCRANEKVVYEFCTSIKAYDQCVAKAPAICVLETVLINA